MALCSVNSEIEDVVILPEEDGLQRIEVYVNLRPNYYHIVMVNRDKLVSPEVIWTFMDNEGRVLLQETVEQEEMVLEN